MTETEDTEFGERAVSPAHDVAPVSCGTRARKLETGPSRRYDIGPRSRLANLFISHNCTLRRPAMARIFS